jgi:uncharacterized protein YndB with AHSA1/START domain
MNAADDRTQETCAFVMERRFAAPRDEVWRYWNDAARMQAWWGPKGCAVALVSFEFRPGGLFHYSMQFPDMPLAWGRFLYRDIVAGQRLSWLNSFATEGGGIARAPFAPSFPLELQIEVALSDRAGGTGMTLRAAPFGASDEERAVFAGMYASMQEGFGGTFDKLDEHLAH